MEKRIPSNADDWSSEGLGREEAARRWRKYFAERHGTPVEVDLYDPGGFSAKLINRGVGQVRLLRLLAPAQRVFHRGAHPAVGTVDHLVHFIHSLHGTIHVTLDEAECQVLAGEAVLLDNARPYILDMHEPHEAIDLIMPMQWVVRYLPDIMDRLGSPIAMRKGWAPPLAAMMDTISLQEDDYPLPRPMVAEQIGHLLALACGTGETPPGRRKSRLTQEIMLKIERGYDDPELTPDRVAAEFRISKRYLQTLLANSGTSFVRELNAVRLDRASELLTDPHTRKMSIGEVAFRCGYLDPAYFARQFRRRFDATPRAWREMN